MSQHITAREVTTLAKAIHASHFLVMTTPLLGAARRKAQKPKAIKPDAVDRLWAEATPKERADYRWEARQVLRTLRAYERARKV